MINNVFSFRSYLHVAAVFVLSLLVACNDSGQAPGSDDPTNNNPSADFPWRSMESGTTNDLLAIWGSSANNVYAVGENGTILHYDGSRWSAEDIGGIIPDFTDVWGSAPDNIYVTGPHGTYHYDGNTWEKVTSLIEVDPASTMISVWMSSPTDIYLLSSYNQIYYSNNGTNWVKVHDNPIGTGGDLYKIRGTGGSDIYAIGNYPVHFDGESWSQIDFGGGTPEPTYNIWANAVDDVYVLSLRLSDNELFHFDGAGWSSMAPGTDRVFCVWADSMSNIFVSAMVTDTKAGIFHFDGAAWTSIEDPTKQNGRILAFWGESTSNLFAVGDNGKILQYVE